MNYRNQWNLRVNGLQIAFKGAKNYILALKFFLLLN